jgi:CheY-like chemotaxis protein
MSEDKCKVLVVDDHRDGADAAVLLLGSWGHDAVAAYSAQHALTAAREIEPDVALLDLGLPDKDGFELARELRAVVPGIRLIALTGFTRADIVRRSREAGFADHLVKPAPSNVLKEVVHSQCEESRKS